MGSLCCLLSAAGFGAMAVFAKLAYAEDVDLDSLLVLRFGLAGVVLLVVAGSRGALRHLSGRTVVIALAMGAAGYACQAGLYFVALTRVDASQVALVFCTYPLLVMVTAIALRRDAASPRRIVALGLAAAGLCLVLGGAATGSFDPVGALLALGSAVTYTGYILVGDRIAADIPGPALAALVCVGACATFTVVSLVRGGGPDLALSALGWLWVGLLVLISTVGAILLFFVGLAGVGPTVASLLGIVEPVVTVGGAALVFHELVTPGQVAGGVLVLAGVALVSVARPGRPGRRTPEPLPVPA